MSRSTAPSALLRTARERAGLSQRALAQRAGTTQSVVARIERGTTDPGWNTLQRLLRAAGYDLEAELVPHPTARSRMMGDVARTLRLSPEDRLREVAAISRFLVGARRV
jgi:transcriptional regulator with XRE-family HTH domain